MRTNKIQDLRARSEALLSPHDDFREIDPLDVRKLVHELQVHQIELKIQNGELREAQEKLEASRSKYVDLYDFAPVGYFTLDVNGLIREVNLTGAALLGTERGRLKNRPFLHYVFPESRLTLHHFLQDIFSDSKKRSAS